MFSYENLDKEALPCNLCGSNDHQEIFVGDRYKMGIRTVSCRECGLVFINPRPTKDVFLDFYKNHYRKFYESAETPDEEYIQKGEFPYRASIIFNHLKEFTEDKERFNAPLKVLDVGCSEGSTLRYFLEHSTKNVEAVGIEPSVNFSKFAKEYTGADIYNGTLDAFCEERTDAKFNLIILNHVLEHFLDPSKQLKRIHNLMDDDGLLFVEVPDILGEWAGVGMFHLAHIYQFCEMTLRNMLAKAGFSPVKIRKKGNHLHPWAMTFIVKKDPDSKVILPSKKEIKKHRDIIIEKLVNGGALPPQNSGF